MRAKRSRSQRVRLRRNSDWKPLSIIFLVVSVPTIGTMIIVLSSSRPSLSDRTFSNPGDAENVKVLDWPTLYGLSNKNLGSDRLLQDLAGSVVRVPGYLLPFEQSADQAGTIREFLLVPDPGNWLHPPHLDSGEVVLVRISGELRTPLLNRVPVWVEGRLSPRFVTKRSLERALELAASSVWELKEIQ